MDIVIKNAKVHNLRGIDVTIPRNSLTVITGLSGSGKSSLAFDTLYAEGQRRYVESLSAYARQFLDRMEKPDVERIDGLSPAISIEQRTTSGNPRSIVATVTEIHDYLRILYGSIATPHCPHCGKPVTKQSAEQIVNSIGELSNCRIGESKDSADHSSIRQFVNSKILILAPVVKGKKGAQLDVFAALKRNGFARVKVDGETYLLDEVPELDKKKAHNIDVVIDRLVLPGRSGKDTASPAENAKSTGAAESFPRLPSDLRTRLTDSVELALKTGKGILTVEKLADAPGTKHQALSTTYSELNACVDCGLSFDELKPRSFSFNSPFGACPKCSGLGQLYFFDEDLIVPDKTLPLEECIHPWRRLGGQMAILYHKELLVHIAKQYKVKLSTPYEKLPASFRKGLMHGFKDDLVLPWRRNDKPFEGVIENLQRKMEEAPDDEVRAKYAAYQNFKTCPDCGGSRLNEFSRVAEIAGKTIVDVMSMPITDCLAFFGQIGELTNGRVGESGDHSIIRQFDNSTIGKLAALKEINGEIIKRLQFLLDVGLDYLTLDRASSTLSGGEMQRIRLATQIGSGLTGVLYVLDEPTIGLHPRDNERLIATLKNLRDRGNTVVIVEHDEEMMRAADYIVDLGPGAGREGGKVMYQGDFAGLLKANSLTADYLTGRKSVGEFSNSSIRQFSNSSIRQFSNSSIRQFSNFLTISRATAHNLRNVTAHVPVGSLTVVTGVSGSGKSSLVYDTLKPRMLAKMDSHFDKMIEIDQSPIGRTPRSNPATYVGFYSDIRDLFSKTEAAKARGYTPGRFSFNVKGGRCEVCGGDGVQKLEMSFLPDVYVTCEQCGGKRFNAETLEVTYGGKNISEVLEMSVAEGCEFFAKIPSIYRKLKTLRDVGLGYIALGQSSTTLSGGEAQRIKLATELCRRSTGKTLYLLDEPTTGLHFDDVAKLMKLLTQLRDQGNTILIIEHNLDVIRMADWIIDLGPGGGDKGGKLVFEGTVPELKKCKESFTAKFL